MTIETHSPDRKLLVRALEKALGVKAHYEGMPTGNYTVGEYTVDRKGNITGADFEALRGFLIENGYAADDAAGIQDAQASENEPSADSKAEEQTVPAAEASIDEQVITIPAPGMEVTQLKNLAHLLYSRQRLLNLMAGGDTIEIPETFIEALREANPETPEAFESLVAIHREQGMRGFDYKAGEFNLTFPFYETEPTRWTAFAGLQGRILQAARAAVRVSPDLIRPEQEAEKYTAHNWLQRLGYRGPEMKEQRNILLKHLHGYCAFSNGSKMKTHKDKYAAIRKERREARRAEAGEAPASEAEALVTAEARNTAAE